ncbi:GTPase ObgE [Candidatus Fermentibacteria bacterium]|nr:GTPase ObgE [Candidatus Fermentibacteria bacterium]
MESRFVDRLVIRVSGGRGGDGMVAFRREAFVPRGGPSGGDGGKGGDVILRVDTNLATLADFPSGTLFKAGDGRPGGPNQRTGRTGEDSILPVPPGTTVTDLDSGEELGDLSAEGAELVVAKGGAPGHGNARYKSSRRQAPRFATRGRPGESRRIALDLRLIADAGLLGLPNAGKSTLLSRVSRARPRIGDYPFTTLHPCLGVVERARGFSFVLADLPGLVEGASSGAGLGLRFLRHAERTSLLVFVLAPDLDTSPEAQIEILRGELTAYSGILQSRDSIFILSKADLLTEDRRRTILDRLPDGTLAVSAATGEGVEEFLTKLSKAVREARSSSQGQSSAPRGGERAETS